MKIKFPLLLVTVSLLGTFPTVYGCQSGTPEAAPTLAPPTEQDAKAQEIIKNRPPRPPRGNKAEVGGPSER